MRVARELFLLMGLLVCYLVLVGYVHPSIWSYQMEQTLIPRYLRSQDIVHEVPRRVFLSDSQIHIAAGMLYVSGKQPLEYNFQHPPLGKYLFGLSVLLTGNPFWVQLLAGLALVIGTYGLGKSLFGAWVGLGAGVLLVLDPLFLSMSGEALLDLIQAAFILFYVLILLNAPRNFWIQGLLLGCVAMTKFWSTTMIIGILGMGWLWWSGNWKLSERWSIITVFISMMLVVVICYFDSLKSGISLIDLLFWQAKILNYWLHHSVASVLGNAWALWFFGVYKNWWEPYEWRNAQVWSVLWPVSWIGMMWGAWVHRYNSRRVLGLLFGLFYLGMLGFQAPFERYFVVLLPFIYVGVVGMLTEMKTVS